MIPLASVSWPSALWSDRIAVDVIVFVVLGGIHVAAWWGSNPSDPKDITHWSEAAAAMTAASTAGVTAVGILLPLSLVSAQIRPPGPGPLEQVFIADLWFALSLVMGLVSVYTTAPRATTEYVIRRKLVGITFGLQLIALGIGVIRLLIGIAGVIGG